MAGKVEEIYVTSKGSAAMERAAEVRAVEGRGLEGDRYSEGTGFWTRYGDVCQVTLIEGEGLDEIQESGGPSVHDGEHRRNIVTRGVKLADLRGKRFRVGQAVLEYDRPRPPCKHVQQVTEPGMTNALRHGRGGICARVVEGGGIHPGDAIEVLS